MILRLVVLLAVVGISCIPGHAQETEAEPWDMLTAKPEVVEAWQDMRFGMFVHWGPVSLKGTEIGWSRKGPRRGRSRPVYRIHWLVSPYIPARPCS